ncbi:MAG: hypothetical protein JHD16_11025 [Solirubrobacteraceae bacterium]|nr:hypothetical protein [Solirubrobacteraceae bacterium]
MSLRNTSVTLWHLSRWLHRRGLGVLARIVKTINLLLFSANLEPEAEVHITAHLGHLGIGVTIHGSTIIEDGVVIWQHVTIGGVDNKASTNGAGVTLCRNVHIGAHSVVIAPRGERIVIGEGARIAPGSVVRSSIPAGAIVAPAESTIVKLPGQTNGSAGAAPLVDA